MMKRHVKGEKDSKPVHDDSTATCIDNTHSMWHRLCLKDISISNLSSTSINKESLNKDVSYFKLLCDIPKFNYVKNVKSKWITA